MKANIPTLLIALLALPAVTRAQFTYITNADNTITITGYTGVGGDVTIPAVIDGLTVTSIGEGAFGGTSLTSVTIPDGVTDIEDGAFAKCFALTMVTIGNGVTNIGGEAFYGCSAGCCLYLRQRSQRRHIDI
jgi:BspA type Leucine rich repeat region (6 copies)